jgi:Xaa-Pro aminopeptidase
MLFPIDEYEARVARVRDQMSARELDVLIIDQTEFLAYLTGFSISENMTGGCRRGACRDNHCRRRQRDRAGDGNQA